MATESLSVFGFRFVKKNVFFSKFDFTLGNNKLLHCLADKNHFAWRQKVSLSLAFFGTNEFGQRKTSFVL